MGTAREPVIVVGSVTYAMKSRQILFRQGIRCYVERIPPGHGNGCGYGVYVPERTDAAERLLRDAGIHVLGRSERVGSL